jgi:putative ABC transport system permease protein
MSVLRARNRAMFWRILRHLLSANPGRLFVILLALGAGSTVAAALLNLQVDAKRRLTTEFRALGANVIIAPKSTSDSSDVPNVMDETVFDRIPERNYGNEITKGEFLYGIVEVAATDSLDTPSRPEKSVKAVVSGFAIATGHQFLAHALEKILPSTLLESRNVDSLDGQTCDVGQNLAAKLNLHLGARLTLTSGEKTAACTVSGIRSFGGPEDSQVFLKLRATQALLELPGQVSLMQVSVPGTPESIHRYIADLQKQLPEVDVHGIRQFTEGEAKIYNRVSGLLSATVGVVLLLTGLCVMAAMTNVAMERRNDVGLMKAIGGGTRRVLRIFLTEAAVLGLAGGVLGGAAGILLSVWLGKQVFGVAAHPRMIVYPVAVALTMLVAIAGAFPLRRLASIRPAAVFRGEA